MRHFGPALYRALFDDAALFPPGNAPMGEAIPAHRAHRASRRAPYVGPFLVADARLAELRTVLSREEPGAEPLALVVTVPGGADGVAAAVDAVRADPALALAGVEVAAAPGAAADTAAAVVKALAQDSDGPGAVGYVEVARGEEAAADIGALAGTGAHAKFRTGGVTAQAHPGESELAALLAAAIGAGVSFKCTAGLHHAVRHTSAEGFQQHGFLNALLATHALLAGADAAGAAEILAERDGRVLAARAAALSPEQVERVRSSFRSFGTCSIVEPLDDLVVLGALNL